ncbi:MAG: hypothetical protein B7Y51_01065 [Burkholderiales bacterium 28-67-8]|nr:MAG: hypothetical protein B7Y51_01065 [Burkholderiales bacterium 28-67-8]
MRRIAATLAACLLAGCSSNPNIGTSGEVVRAKPPVNYASTINNYIDLTVKGAQTSRELNIGIPERGSCPMGQGNNGHVGWVVPVQYSALNKDGSTVTITKYFFWFADERLKGVTRRMEVCP